ncbi:hypothetical protein POM88_047497 [Heracleum sosnowskyi]|uniref:Serine aminopeptidase S33 domain-containing protein n=1 Tax=Heracleum sosnowskyi TaxID=360622 RepID=A0AAD8LYS8_9APIA|nr:hypothetical protein POM88_047497 [Heracleum sosnowskyi]
MELIYSRRVRFVWGCGTRLANYGYAVVGIDYEGHGRSMGARCYIKKFENIANDCIDFFKSICAYGVNMLNKTGFIYARHFAKELGKKAIYLGMPFVAEWFKDEGHFIKSQVSATTV